MRSCLLSQLPLAPHGPVPIPKVAIGLKPGLTKRLAIGLLTCVPLPGVDPLEAAAKPSFTEVAGEAGIDFRHRNGMTGELYFMEMMGGGAALFDADGDGDLDLYLTQGRRLGAGDLDTETEAEPGGRLYRNDTAADRPHPELRFTDITVASGLRSRAYGMGVATGDVDGDGFVDLYLTNLGPNELWRSRGDGSFEEIGQASATADPAWSVSATLFDFDRDGDLDLFVANYVDSSIDNHRLCHTASAIRTYCKPGLFRPLADRLLRNRGDGSFEDATHLLDGAAAGPGLGVVAEDLDGDGFIDLFVANDQQPNFLWRNLEGGGFSEQGLVAGVALNREGKPEASMGIAVADFDDDGDSDLFLTHLSGETNTLYVNDGRGLFEDRTVAAELAASSVKGTGFGTGFIDYDNDGDLDLFVANGAVQTIEELYLAGDPFPLRQTSQLLRNDGGRFGVVAARAGFPELAAEVGRGVAHGDLDNDGDTDLVVVNNGGPLQLLRNQTGSAAPWLGLRLLTGRRDAFGAQVEAQLQSGRRLRRRVASDGSYASASDSRVLFGLGGATVEQIVVRWVSGRLESWRGLELRRYHTLVEGSGSPVAPEARR